MSESREHDQIEEAFRTVRDALLSEREPEGFWVGQLCSSALSTATAVSALCLAGAQRHAGLIDAGLQWLVRTQNDDGSWGDSSNSPGNISTTMLVRAALKLADSEAAHSEHVTRAEKYLTGCAGATPDERVRSLVATYGKDRTFAVPILTNCALAGMVDWAQVPTLPFELAWLPRSLLNRLRLHVVSYALPALIAIGQLLHQRRPTANPLTRLLRRAALKPTRNKLESIQPESGGFIEAVPLTSFVVMTLAAAGQGEHPVARKGLAFIERSARADGSWPIDSNLSTWVTTQAVQALTVCGEPDEPAGLTDWLLAQQHTAVHPFTGSAPGGWSWTSLSGGVPDADDTAGTLVALAELDVDVPTEAVRAGLRWLANLQNSNGGWPTFCRGWQKLPFDRSGPDLTAHAIRALLAWPDVLADRTHRRIIRKGFAYLARAQRPDGSWMPLWFGNQHTSDAGNPVYGTARVLKAYAAAGMSASPEAGRGLSFLVGAQNENGSWGGAQATPGSVEETGLAVEALAASGADGPAWESALAGACFLSRQITQGTLAEGTPIGLYFARLWYWEKLYPLIWSVGGLGAVLRRIDAGSSRRQCRRQTIVAKSWRNA